MNRASYKDILRYILDSEECKIDSAKARNFKTLVEHLCTTVNDEFMKYYLMVEMEVSQIKKKGMFKKMYKYCAQTMANYLKEWIRMLFTIIRFCGRCLHGLLDELL